MQHIPLATYSPLRAIGGVRSMFYFFFTLL
nr:MAG TPA: hypothetical protein [Caudoviricetes sp.]